MSRATRMLRRQALKDQPVEGPASVLHYQPSQALPYDGVRLAIASPMMDMCHSSFATSMFQLIANTMAMCPGMALHFLQYGTSILPMSRQLLVAKANEANATHILFIDSDMTFPPDLIARLLAHRKPIIGANCMARRFPFRLTAQRDGTTEVLTNKDSTGIQQVDRVGTGLMLVNMDVFKTIPLPWFEYEWLPELKVFRGEDYVFCNKATAAGFDIWVDHDVSKQVEHIGQIGFNPMMREAILATMAGSKA